MTRNINIPSFIICGGSIFCFSNVDLDLTSHLQCFWTLTFLFLTIAFCSMKVLMSANVFLLSKQQILLSYLCLGGIEIVYSLLQVIGVVPNFYHHAFFSGSLGNPAIFGMFVSYCAIISAWFGIKCNGSTRKRWMFVMIFFVVFVFFSNSRTAFLATICAISIIVMIEIEYLRHFLVKRKWWLLCSFIVGIIFLYFYKRDSADGRLLIWNICFDLINEKPIVGWGHEGFVSQYMYRQADFFLRHPDSSFGQLADMINVPFNEYLYFAILYGCLFVLIAIIAIIGFVRFLYENALQDRSLLIAFVVSILVWCMFSYPLHIPFVWLIIMYVFLEAFLLYYKKHCEKMLPLSLLVGSLFCLLISTIVCYKESRRLDIENSAFKDGIKIDVFERNYKDYQDDGQFLYSYGVALHNIGEYEKSIKILNECSKHIADYNVQLLLGDNYQQLGMSDSAIARYDMASKMIPNRFLPLYYQMRLYKDIGQNNKAKKMAQNILSKKIKVDNTATREIIREARECLSIK